MPTRRDIDCFLRWTRPIRACVEAVVESHPLRTDALLALERLERWADETTGARTCRACGAAFLIGLDERAYRRVRSQPLPVHCQPCRSQAGSNG